jgi:hypothetical protein
MNRILPSFQALPVAEISHHASGVRHVVAQEQAAELGVSIHNVDVEVAGPATSMQVGDTEWTLLLIDGEPWWATVHNDGPCHATVVWFDDLAELVTLSV